MKLVTWNNGGLSSFGEGAKQRLVSDMEISETVAQAKEDLQEGQLGRDWSPVINVYDVIFSYKECA